MSRAWVKAVAQQNGLKLPRKKKPLVKADRREDASGEYRRGVEAMLKIALSLAYDEKAECDMRHGARQLLGEAKE